MAPTERQPHRPGIAYADLEDGPPAWVIQTVEDLAREVDNGRG